MAAHWPIDAESMSELASGSPSFEEGFFCLEPHQFLFGAQTPLFCALKPRGVRRFLDIYFFSDGAKLCPQSNRFFAAYTRGQARRLSEIPPIAP